MACINLPSIRNSMLEMDSSIPMFTMSQCGQMTGLTGTSYQVDDQHLGNHSAPDWQGILLSSWSSVPRAKYWLLGWALLGQRPAGASARAAGFRTGSTHKSGAICWTDGGYGHVGVVTHVESNTRIQIKESTMQANSTLAFRGWFNPRRGQELSLYLSNKFAKNLGFINQVFILFKSKPFSYLRCFFSK